MEATRAAESILRGYPQSDQRANMEFMTELTKLMATLTSEELGWIMDPREGIKARCKFLPTPADIMELIREKCAARDAVTASEPRGYEKFEPSPWTEEDVRRYNVRQKARPFPALYAKLEEVNAQDLLDGQTFDVLYSASRELAVSGLDAAMSVLRRTMAASREDLERKLADMKLSGPPKSDLTPQLRKLLNPETDSEETTPRP